MKKLDIKALAESVINDENQEAWEERKLGNDAANASVSVKTSIRLPDSLLASLKVMAGDAGMPYQTYMKHVLHRHVQDEIKRVADR